MPDRLSPYLEQEILGASNLELIHLLYQSAIAEIREARRHQAAGRIAQKCTGISKACDLICELKNSLDSQKGGEIADRLDGLYAYMLSRLLEANLKRLDAPMAEVAGLLATLDEAWKQLAERNMAESPGVALGGIPPGVFQEGFRENFRESFEAPVHAWSL